MKISWLLGKHPPHGPAWDGEERLWWASIRLAARDTLRGHKSLALDGAEFLYSTGVWLCQEMFQVTEEETKRELVRLMRLNPNLDETIENAITT